MKTKFPLIAIAGQAHPRPLRSGSLTLSRMIEADLRDFALMSKMAARRARNAALTPRILIEVYGPAPY